MNLYRDWVIESSTRFCLTNGLTIVQFGPNGKPRIPAISIGKRFPRFLRANNPELVNFFELDQTTTRDGRAKFLRRVYRMPEVELVFVRFMNEWCRTIGLERYTRPNDQTEISQEAA